MRRDNHTVRIMGEGDVQPMALAFTETGKTAALFRRYVEEQQEEKRTGIVALKSGAFVGYVTIR